MKKIILILVVGVGIGAGVARAQAPGETARELLAEREQLDETLWAPEVLAQRYERRFVTLWDALIHNENRFEILSEFPFEELSVGEPSTPESMDHGIRRTSFGAPGRTLSHAEWQELLARFKAQGYEIEHTEFHHSQFDPPVAGGTAHSVVSAVLHAVRANPSHRVILRATLDVDWSPNVDDQDIPLPARITVTKLQMLERDTAAAFRQVFEVKGGPGGPLLPLLVYDLDGDGLSEIILAGQNAVAWNRGGGQFELGKFLEDAHNLSDEGVLADFTNDGIVDYVAVDTSRYPLLFEGDAGGKFTKPAHRIADVRFEQPKSFTAGDIDGDGDLDLFIANYKKAYEEGQMPTPYYDANDGYPASLLRNNGDGTFTDVTEEAGLAPKRFRRTYSSSLVDLDGDADMDLLVVSDYAGFDLYLNDGKGRFTDVSDQFGIDRHMFGMSHTFGDYDLDGDLDFYVIGMSSTTARRLEQMGLRREDKAEETEMRKIMGYGNRMFLRQGNGWVTAPFNDDVARTGWSWGTSSFDFDNDGDRDIFVANGHVSGQSTQDYCTAFWRHDIYTDDSSANAARESVFQLMMDPLAEAKISWNGYEHKVLFMNEGGRGFTNISYLMGTAFEYDARAAVTDDLDGDGKVDLLVVESKAGGPTDSEYILHVYRNELDEAGNWIGVRLREEGRGFSPVGARVTVKTTAGTQIAQVVTGDSYSSQHATTVHFGLGDETAVEAIEVRWPNGTTRRLDHPDINRYHSVGSQSMPTQNQ